MYSVFLTFAVAYVLLDTFVIPKSYMSAADNLPMVSRTAGNQTDYDDVSPTKDTSEAIESVITEETPKPRISDTYYADENIVINIETLRAYNTTIHIADISVTDINYFKCALAENTFGRNISGKTSVIAGQRNAIFAVNGDYYGFRDVGYVVRNGTLYRGTGNNEALILFKDGNFAVSDETDISSESVQSAWQIWSFGPALIKEGSISVTTNSEISGRSSNSNPRTAIGMIEPLHYIFIVSEGRTNDNQGLSLFQLAGIFDERKCTTAYNLDGGGSSTMYFNGNLVNNPTTNGTRINEREVSDIVYIGYE
jgi:exopolysaccharide biosynthesis protein